jgi:hypothetical protein
MSGLDCELDLLRQSGWSEPYSSQTVEGRALFLPLDHAEAGR